ncbi:OLC1v1039058C1 [Oldenlandia corymbosa var. corymbosa]|uniref:Vacuolar iron transporter n=1 Tax=Oldenlandia corymbosa var. corymbosa TaxID=529605 RepID=A0AAV1D1C3_OLDCO|nr:OLC1v1039058C1 [Oldenlandia corymbosa var. corymbosa]
MAENDNAGSSRTTNPLLLRVADHLKEEEGNKNQRPQEPWQAHYLKSIVYAGLYSIVTSFSLISSISGGRLSSVDVLVLGFANLVADGISMGFGDFISTSLGRDMAENERSLTKWEVANHRRHEEHELLQKYRDLGMNSDAAAVVTILSTYMDILVGEKMVNEKGMLPPDQSADQKPWKNGLVTFLAFLVFGFAPLLAFTILIPFTPNSKINGIESCSDSLDVVTLTMRS